ncbi:CocE/NonD family hydrolase [Sphingobium sp. MK2]|uniref:CocE/NonD family hydrolase n=1 Tax=Sphingobium sp. MK2 TaxID=3116540 RepID=UPI0032E365FC
MPEPLSQPAFDGEILFRKSTPLSDLRVRYQGFAPAETILPAGTIMREGARALTCDILFQRDVPVKLRDGTTIYTDVFRPINSGPVPAILAWSPYGKNLGGFHLDDFPFRMGVPNSLVSELNKWEAPDPAVWCARGYAVVNPDARGTYTSEGDAWCWSQQEGCDGADVVDWIGTQDWCSGKVGMAGNSWLAASQWFIAAERPKHLAAIAPWEGLSDLYNNVVCTGGVPDIGFMDYLITLNAGKGRIEDIVAMLRKYPQFNAYWQDHAARIDQIQVPAYVVASYSSPLHVHGTFDAFRALKSDKWLRVHPIQEWPDFYDPANQEDLARFFDFYLKDRENGWEQTPKVRISVFSTGPDNAVVENRAEADFPLARERYVAAYLDAADMTGSTDASASPASITFSATEGEGVAFEFTAPETMEIIGYPELVLYAEGLETDNFDLFIRMQKINLDGTVFQALTLPEDSPIIRANRDQVFATRDTPFKYILFYEGPWGRIRASHRAVDPDRSRIGRPYLKNDSTALLGQNELVMLRIGLTPTALELKQGEKLRINIETRDAMHIPYGDAQSPQLRQGQIVIHTGGDHQSHLLLPNTIGA